MTISPAYGRDAKSKKEIETMLAVQTSSFATYSAVAEATSTLRVCGPPGSGPSPCVTRKIARSRS